MQRVQRFGTEGFFALPKAVATLLMLASCVSPSASREYLVHNLPEYEKLAAKLAPGDIVTLANGDWKNAELIFEAHGTAAKPVTLRAQTKGAVILSGRSSLRLAGEYLVVSGLVFRNGYSADSDLISFRRKQGVVASNSRLTEIVIDNFSQPDPEEGENWIALYGHDNRVDHSHIVGKASRGVTLAVIRDDPQPTPDRHRIDHNYFGHRPPLGSNGGETIRVGTSDLSRSDSKTVIEENYFEECDGEAEIISIKSGGNIIRRNVIVASQGSIVLRHGDGNVVERNVILGKGKPETGGIRIINARHIVRDNYIEGVTGTDFYAAIAIMNGAKNPPLNGYSPVTDTLIERNSIINSAQVAIGAGAGDKRGVSPTRTTFTQNLVVGKDGVSPFTVGTETTGIAFVDNRLSEVPADLSESMSGKPVALARAANGLLYPADVADRSFGAPRDLASVARSEVGVSWYKSAAAKN